MADSHETTPSKRSPRALATRGEVYFGFFIIWLFLSFAFGEFLQTEDSWDRFLYWAVSLLMVAVYAVVVVGMWWVGRREQRGM
ncbi:MAG: hypothetical protein KY475_16840 [Planctomycetes bacterium]|nr:hypothetical protein [Planctomycetota bacterium]